MLMKNNGRGLWRDEFRNSWRKWGILKKVMNLTINLHLRKKGINISQDIFMLKEELEIRKVDLSEVSYLLI